VSGALDSSRLRLGIDYFPAATHAPGVGRYARELTRALVELQSEHQLRLLDFGRGAQVMSEQSLGLNEGVLRRRVPLPARMLGLAARLGWGADRWLGGVDLFHHVRLNGPPVSRALETHAVSQWPGPAEEELFLERLAQFDGLFVFCEEYRRRLLSHADRIPARVSLLPVGADHWLRDLGGGVDSLEKHSPPRVLVLGAAFADRRHALILEACELLVRGGLDLRLFLAGSTRVGGQELRARIEGSAIAARVEWRSPAEVELPELVAGSSLLVHLCDDPGTAVTPMESLLLGVPVLVSAVPAFREALGEAACFFEGQSATELASSIEAALDHRPAPELLAAFRRRYTWRENARSSLTAWEELFRSASL
jgi:glycosyltransferase involved in cell wall biosynthesis